MVYQVMPNPKISKPNFHTDNRVFVNFFSKIIFIEKSPKMGIVQVKIIAEFCRPKFG